MDNVFIFLLISFCALALEIIEDTSALEKSKNDSIANGTGDDADIVVIASVSTSASLYWSM
jgi:hypothetical protein